MCSSEFCPCFHPWSKVRDWVSILPGGVTFKNAFRARKWIDDEDKTPLPQSFTFMARAGKVNLFQLTHSHCFESTTSVTKSNQYFAYYRSECFSPAAGLPNQGSDLALSDRVPRALRSEDVMDDVFCMVKERMATDGLCQAPLLCLPGSFLQQSQQMLRRANDPQCPVQTCHLESDRRDELRTLKFAMGKTFLI